MTEISFLVFPPGSCDPAQVAEAVKEHGMKMDGKPVEVREAVAEGKAVRVTVDAPPWLLPLVSTLPAAVSLAVPESASG